MKNTLKKITAQEVTKIFSEFSNYPKLFAKLAFKKTKIPVSFLTSGKI